MMPSASPENHHETTTHLTEIVPGDQFAVKTVLTVIRAQSVCLIITRLYEAPDARTLAAR